MSVNEKKLNGFRVPTWANLAAVVLFFAATSGWAVSYGVQREKINGILANISALQERLAAVENWQDNWPREGELMMDRTQNAELKELRRRILKLEECPLDE